MKHHHLERLDKIPDQCLHSTILYNPLTPICNEEARSFHVWELLRLTLLHPLYSSRTKTQLGSKHSNPILNTTTPNYSLDKIPDRCLDSTIQSKPCLLPSATKRRCSFRKQFGSFEGESHINPPLYSSRIMTQWVRRIQSTFSTPLPLITGQDSTSMLTFRNPPPPPKNLFLGILNTKLYLLNPAGTLLLHGCSLNTRPHWKLLIFLFIDPCKIRVKEIVKTDLKVVFRTHCSRRIWIVLNMNKK